jgi:hypothetical protein
MKKLLNFAWMLVVGFCVGTIITQTLLAAVLWPKMKLDRERVSRIAAIAQGIDAAAKEDAKSSKLPEGEQPSYQEIVEARAVKYRNLELREQQLRNNLVQVQSAESKLADESKKYKQLREGFDIDLVELQKTSTSTGMEELRQIIGKLKPKQAKEVLVEMLDKKEIDKVVILLREMPLKSSTKIIAEFKTGEDLDKISEVLRRLREGEPEINLVDNAKGKIEPKKSANGP